MSDQSEISQGMLFAQFVHYGKSNFQDLIHRKVTEKQFFEQVRKAKELHVAENMIDRILSEKNIFFYLTSDVHLIRQAKEWLRSLVQHKGIQEPLDEVTEQLFIEWQSASSGRKKKSTYDQLAEAINANPNKDNFLQYFYTATINLFDKEFYNEEWVVGQLEGAENILNEISADASLINGFKQLILWYRGMLFLQTGRIDEASEAFFHAYQIQTDWLSGIYYTAICEIMQGDAESAMAKVKQLFEFDLKRLRYAINANKQMHVAYFLTNASIYSIFDREEFAILIEQVKEMIEPLKDEDASPFGRLQRWLGKLHALRIEEYFDAEVKEEVGFLDNITLTYGGNKNAFFAILANDFFKKLVDCVERIKASVSETYRKRIQESLTKFDEKLTEENNHLQKLRKETAENIEKLKEQQAIFTDKLNEKHKQKRELLLKQLKKTEKTKVEEPKDAFGQSLKTNMMVTFALAMIGGIIEATGSESGFMQGMIIGFLKWGVLVFIFAVIISIFTAMSKTSEVKKRIRNLKKMIQKLDKNKESEKKSLDKKFEKKIQAEEFVHKHKMDQLEKSLNSIIEEKEKTVRALEEKVESEKKSIFKRLDNLFT